MDFKKLKFLIVDDNQDMLEHIEGLFLAIGAVRVEKLKNPLDAFGKIKKCATENLPYALVTLDWDMPSLSGPDLLKQIREDPKTKSQPVLMVTGKSNPEDIKKLVVLQPDGYVVKPFTEEIFETKVKAVLEKTGKKST